MGTAVSLEEGVGGGGGNGMGVVRGLTTLVVDCTKVWGTAA